MNASSGHQDVSIKHTSRHATKQDEAGGPVRTRILFITHSGELYGAERSLLTLLKGLQQTGQYELMVFSPEPGAFTRVLNVEGIDVRILPFARWIGLRYHFAARYVRRLKNRWSMPRLVREAKQWNPDIIYTNTIATPVGAFMAAKLPGKPCHIWHARELPGQTDSGFGRFDLGSRTSFRIMARTADRFICNSKFLHEKLKPKLESESGRVKERGKATNVRMDIVLNGFEITENIPVAVDERGSGQSVRIVMAGGISPVKNYGEAVLGVQRLNDAGFGIQLDIYGSGSEIEVVKLKKQITDARLNNRVRLMGYTNNIMTELARADMLLVTSKMETFGRIAVEAMLAGCPVISSDAGALPEIIRDGETGLLYRSGDVEHLAFQVRKMAESTSLRNEIIGNAAEYAREHFTARRFVTEINQILQELLSARESGKSEHTDRLNANHPPRIAIVLSTWNGEQYLPELLESLRLQTWPHWDLWVRDDGSNDGTINQLEAFSNSMNDGVSGNRVIVNRGRNIGIVRSFLTLLSDITDEYAGYAFCDQDDIWLPEKLERAATALAVHQDNENGTGVPCLYHAGLWLTDDRNNKRTKNPAPVRTGFSNALIQNQVVGCTMVINPALRECILNRIRSSVDDDPATSIIMHDWWCYLLASGFGSIIYDPEPVIAFRRHHKSTTPAETTPYRALHKRITAIRKRDWSVSHIIRQAEAFARLYANDFERKQHAGSQEAACPPNLLSEDNKKLLDSLISLKHAGFLKRLRYLFWAEHKRDGILNTLVFRFLVLFRRF